MSAPKPSPTVRDLIDAVLAGGGDADPHAVSRAVLGRIPPRRMAAALAEVLPVFVRVTYSQRRMLPQPAPAPVVDGKGRKFASPRLAMRRSEWERMKAAPVAVGGTWKRLADCTRDDLLAVESDLRVRADMTAAKADWYAELAKSLAPGQTVADLDTDPTRKAE